MAVDGSAIGKDDGKGKAVYVHHTWKDFLWDMGSGKKMQVPEPRAVEAEKVENQVIGEVDDENEEGGYDHAEDASHLNLAPPNGSTNQEELPSSSSQIPATTAQPETSSAAPPENKPSPLTPEGSDRLHNEQSNEAIANC